ncbi:hypothetical protein [Streptomyces sp. 3211]|uniref:hypothetical protein n=1 Tax=Streptomyces sp. 3211 TaxID=1964449 RepID=UPI00133190DE|nr:hypothetical protein [Streptomyces sp. 3211]
MAHQDHDVEVSPADLKHRTKEKLPASVVTLLAHVPRGVLFHEQATALQLVGVQEHGASRAGIRLAARFGRSALA